MGEYRSTLLVVDDDSGLLESYQLLFEESYDVLVASAGDEALSLLRKSHVDLVLLDIRLPDRSGVELLREFKAIDPSLSVVMVTAVGDVRVAVESMKLGAADYLVKPLEPDGIRTVVEKCLAENRLAREWEYFKSASDGEFAEIMTQDRRMVDLLDMVRTVADTDTTVLIQGETGTGKEMIARAIHRLSGRKDRPFVAINCSAIPEDLFESELFGHEKGAFTGAINRKLGKIEFAHGGTLFLDEVGSLKREVQPKLMRVLQEKEFERVGSIRTIKVDVRWVAACNRNLKQCVDEGSFRDDLYYRLSVVPLWVPALRERRDDISLLLRYFLQKFNRKFNRSVKDFGEGVLEALQQYSWPGNVRELQNIVERLVVIGRGDTIKVDDLPMDLVSLPPADEAQGTSLSLKETLRSVERNYITRVLEQTHWNQTKAAALLGVHRNTLLNKMSDLEIRSKH